MTTCWPKLENNRLCFLRFGFSTFRSTNRSTLVVGQKDNSLGQEGLVALLSQAASVQRLCFLPTSKAWPLFGTYGPAKETYEWLSGQVELQYVPPSMPLN